MTASKIAEKRPHVNGNPTGPSIGKNKKRPVRVLHIGKYFPPSPGGIENFTADLIPALAELGVESRAIVHDDPRFPKPPNAGGFSPERVPCLGTFFFAPVSPGFPRAISRAINDFRPDLIYFHMPNVSAFWALFLPRARKIPWVLDWHSDVAPSKIDWRPAAAYPAYFPFERAMLAKARAVIIHSKPCLDHSRPLKKWRRKCRVIPLGIDPARLAPGAHSKNPKIRIWTEKDPSFRVLAVGRLSYYKGHDTLIRAAANLKGVSLVIAGDGERFAALADLIRRMGPGDRAILAGRVTNAELARLMDACHCLCLPSLERTEAFGVTLLEAMSRSKPVIASDIQGSGIGFVVRHKETGLLTRPGDETELAGAIRLMRDRPEMARQMGEAGKKRFDAHFHIRAAARKIASVFETIVS
ncbi:conserved hypothetical protein [Candidatus Desulfarcum epimagneticum]|uniref:Glycosyltransferase n=1 Tax=uncultured Desulfobacteraceae bacterium TaxID=218296 RepID=A0A484HPZ6_9BACT|nr:conserved hypothetical protein [uncultured Desulfobacteraceae bacterium]